MTEEMFRWWPVHWSRANPDKQVPYPLMLLWYYHNVLNRYTS